MNSGKIILSSFDNEVNDKKLSLAALLFTLHVALTPIHQALLLSSGSTINKYLVIVTIGVMLLECLITNRELSFSKDVLGTILPFAIWVCLTGVWSLSRSTTISSLITICSHIILLLMCSSYPFSSREKKIIRYALIIASVIYASSLITTMVSEGSLRSTIVLGTEEDSADENLLCLNIGVAALIAFDNFKSEDKSSLKILNLAAMIIILVGMFSTGSRGGVISILIPLVYLLFKLYPGFSYKKIGLVLLGIGFAVYILSDYSVLSDYLLDRYTDIENLKGSSGRTEIWLDYLTAMVNNPSTFLLGSGFGTEGKLYSEYYSNNYPRATHSDYVSLLASSGITGILFMGYFIWYCWRKTKENDNYLARACIISALIAAVSLNTITRYGFWNVMIFSLIGL